MMRIRLLGAEFAMVALLAILAGCAVDATSDEVADEGPAEENAGVEADEEDEAALVECRFQGTLCDTDITTCRDYMNGRCGSGYYGECQIKNADCGGTSLTRFNTYCCR
jgi:hypothetical protein